MNVPEGYKRAADLVVGDVVRGYGRLNTASLLPPNERWPREEQVMVCVEDRPQDYWPADALVPLERRWRQTVTWETTNRGTALAWEKEHTGRFVSPNGVVREYSAVEEVTDSGAGGS